jgi:hypothetical protein
VQVRRFSDLEPAAAGLASLVNVALDQQVCGSFELACGLQARDRFGLHVMAVSGVEVFG